MIIEEKGQGDQLEQYVNNDVLKVVDGGINDNHNNGGQGKQKGLKLLLK